MPSTLTSASASGPGFSALLSAVRTVYSNEIYFSAQPNFRFDQFATKKTELGVQPGSTITMPKFGNIRRGGPLTEGVRIQANSMSLSTISISVSEQGNAIGVTEALLQTSFYDQLAAAAMLLGRDMAVVLDSQLRDVIVASPNTVYANDKTSRITLLAGDVFQTREFHRLSETLETQNAPKWGNDFYIVFMHPHQIASVKQSPGWVNAALYSGATQIFNGEVGRYNDCRVISTTMMPNGASSTLDSNTGEYADPGYSNALASGVSGNLTTIYQAVAFGEFSYGHAIALPVELRDNGVQDFGREHGLAWYAIWGSGLLETKNSVTAESALASLVD